MEDSARSPSPAMTESTGSPKPPEGASAAAQAALAEEAVLNAAVAFAGHVATAAQRAAEQTAESVPEPMRRAMLRQYYLETATLCLRRLGESYATTTEDTEAEIATLLAEGADRAREAMAIVEALGDLGLDLLDRLID